MKSLPEVLEYNNEDVVHRFAEDHEVVLADAREIFHEMKRWLWLCAKRRVDVANGSQEIAIPLFNEAYVIDLMWHTFLLYTEDYAKFCEEHFGFFLHHAPKTLSERRAWAQRIKQDPEGAKEERTAMLTQVYELIYDEVGPEVLQKWCEEFPERFKSV